MIEYKPLVKQLIFYLILAVFSGGASFSFILLVNHIIDRSIQGSLPEPHNFSLILIIVILLFFVSRRLLSEGIIKMSQNIFWNIRALIVKGVIRAPYPKVSRLKDEVYSALTVDVNNITNASLVIISFFSSIVLVISSFIYLAYLSVPLFIVCLSIILIGVLIYIYSSTKGNQYFKEVRAIEDKFIYHFNSVLQGNKEIKVNKQIGEELLEKGIHPLIKRGREKNIIAYIGYLNSELISQILFFAIMSFILLYAGKYFSIPVGVRVNVVFILLFLLNPIVTIMLSIPSLNQGIISLNKLKELQQKFNYQELHKKHTNKKLDHIIENFMTIKFENYTFSYENTSFNIGPVNLEIQAREVIFIHGGNGAGKTTFINLLLSLFVPDTGSVYLDNKKCEFLDDINRLFTPVFSDFFLFDEFYGIKKVDYKKAETLLELFELTHKVTIKDGKFSSHELSAGQRKRLALITALLEDRPILILDEWAADQDPYFRKKFYEEIIDRISKEYGKAIVAITHDDTYFYKANKLLKMEYGQLTEVINKRVASNIK